MLNLAGTIAQLFELAGIAVIVAGTLFAFGQLAMHLHGLPRQDRTRSDVVSAFRKALGRAILVGLELLVAGDIIRTVAVEPTMSSVLVLGLIVIIRTFLSFSLEVEINGRWPWQQAAEKRSE
ncbi:MAG: DUF1622 domain-containing protein [Erythrobacter sp.]|nr:MAG: DUF1622 domain-containing protein [Erythrobacter sp.]